MKPNNLLGKRVYGFREYAALRNVDEIPMSPLVRKPENSESNSQILDLIYSVNPRTKLPDGDIAMFMSENTSPEVAQFIKSNLMSPHDTGGDNGSYDGLDDDSIARYTRGANESVQDYKKRMYDVVVADYMQRKQQKNEE
jgi:hypothetical protein